MSTLGQLQLGGSALTAGCITTMIENASLEVGILELMRQQQISAEAKAGKYCGETSKEDMLKQSQATRWQAMGTLSGAVLSTVVAGAAYKLAHNKNKDIKTAEEKEASVNTWKHEFETAEPPKSAIEEDAKMTEYKKQQATIEEKAKTQTEKLKTKHEESKTKLANQNELKKLKNEKQRKIDGIETKKQSDLKELDTTHSKNLEEIETKKQNDLKSSQDQFEKQKQIKKEAIQRHKDKIINGDFDKTEKLQKTGKKGKDLFVKGSQKNAACKTRSENEINENEKDMDSELTDHDVIATLDNKELAKANKNARKQHEGAVQEKNTALNGQNLRWNTASSIINATTSVAQGTGGVGSSASQKEEAVYKEATTVYDSGKQIMQGTASSTDQAINTENSMMTTVAQLQGAIASCERA
jgi:hypothetical protein